MRADLERGEAAGSGGRGRARRGRHDGRPGNGLDGGPLPRRPRGAGARPALRGDLAGDRAGGPRAPGCGSSRSRDAGALARLDLAVDGVDQVAPDGWLVKGNGGAHTREKIVGAAAARFVVIASSDKLVERIASPVRSSCSRSGSRRRSTGWSTCASVKRRRLRTGDCWRTGSARSTSLPRLAAASTPRRVSSTTGSSRRRLVSEVIVGRGERGQRPRPLARRLRERLAPAARLGADRVGLPAGPRSRAVGDERGRRVEQRLHDPPGLLDDLPAWEEGVVPAQRVGEEALVGCGGSPSSSAKSRSRSGLRDLLAGRLRADHDRDARVPADAQDDVVVPRAVEAVGPQLSFGTRCRRMTTSVAVTEGLARADQDRHARPAPVLDLEAERDERLRVRVRGATPRRRGTLVLPADRAAPDPPRASP